MEIITSNLLPLGIVGLLLLFGSFLRFWVWCVRPNKWLLVAGLLINLLVLAGVSEVLFGDPDKGSSQPVTPDPVHPSRLQLTHMERLREPWNSEGPIEWLAADTLAQLCQLSYDPPVFADRSAKQLGFSECTPIVAGSMIGYILSEDDVVVIAFRGTNPHEVSDWLSNASRNPVTTERGPIHGGFLSAYQNLESQVAEVLNGKSVNHLWVTGHSLGGALAVVCAYELEEEALYRIKGVVTFGQPRLARPQLANYLKKKLLGRYARFVNREDLVPKIPPSYPHFGSLVKFTDEGVRRSKPERPTYGDGVPTSSKPMTMPYAETPELSEAEYQAFLRKSDQNPPPLRYDSDGNPVYEVQAQMFSDHDIAEYVREVKELLDLD
jgi:pimeloyl-ACP methyl ester carboxylesterase